MRELQDAIDFARQYAAEGRKTMPFRGVLVHTQDQLALIDRQLAERGDLSGLGPDDIDVGIMAAKELRNDEQEFADALQTIQWYANRATGAVP